MKFSSILQSVKKIITAPHNRVSTQQPHAKELRSVNFPTRLVYCVFFVFALPVLAQTAKDQTSDWQDLSDIRDAAERFVQDRSNNPEQHTTVTAGALDSRLRLHKCGSPLEAYLTPGSRLGRNTTVGVRCSSPRQWKLFVPVRVGVSAEVLVANRPLAAGTVLTREDFVSKRRDLSSLRGGYIKAGEAVTGLVLKRRLPEGDALRNELLTTPNVIQRGQKLTISTGTNSAISIKMAGTALSNGRIGERIRVKNHSSGRTVEGVVRSSESVEVGY
ncbi:MAG: flagellar basal body P-ring formation chaperone FlgA [Gammaproteobacteria bacterium]